MRLKTDPSAASIIQRWISCANPPILYCRIHPPVECDLQVDQESEDRDNPAISGVRSSNLFLERFKNTSSLNLVRISPEQGPDRMFPDRSSKNKFLQSSRDLGMLPDILLFDMSIS
ncbi:hypothetical protein HAX54_027225 [Datura stramonium]|uniref:Uncharacterized protein n=1 Tax=Datura stramonium TaxID=4076 RepID=A0ABS8S8J5_DATST|nr:hypothetical protein [Datura stramonium]